MVRYIPVKQSSRRVAFGYLQILNLLLAVVEGSLDVVFSGRELDVKPRRWGENACAVWRDCSRSRPIKIMKIARKETRDHGLWGSLLTYGFLYQVQKGFRGERLGEKRDAKTSCGVPQYLVSKCRDQDYLCAGRLFF
jgi:hypothetical protein